MMFNQGLRMTNKEYREKEGISSSDLKKIMKSPLHYKHYKDHPDENDTPALLFGRAAHKYILETYDFYNEFEVARDFKYGTKEDKQATQDFICAKAIEMGKGEEWDKFISTNPKKDDVVAFYRMLLSGKDVITQEQFEQIDAMRNAMLATPFVSKLINGEHEVSFFWTDEDTGLKCKCRPDSLNQKIHICVDYKTCEDAETESFMRSAIRLGYDVQASYYLDGVKANTGEDYIFVFIAQEKKPPYAVNILEADENFIRSGRQTYKALLETYKECTESGNWHGYLGADGQINSLGVPKWIENMLGESEE